MVQIKIYVQFVICIMLEIEYFEMRAKLIAFVRRCVNVEMAEKMKLIFAGN